jgi:hypothetical protein
MLRTFSEWVQSFFAPKKASPVHSFDLYKPEERYIYSYFDGERIVRADPIELYRRIMSKWPELRTDIAVSQSPSKDAGQCHTRMIETIRELFRVKPLDPVQRTGLTEVETIELLNHFFTFNGEVKKNSSEPPTSPTATSPPMQPPTAEPSSASVSVGSPTTKSSDSGSTESDPSTAEPTKSPSVPEPHSDTSTPASTTTEP